MLKRLLACLAAGAIAGTAFAKLPAPKPSSDADKAAKAEKEAAAKAKEAGDLAKAQDKSVAHYKKAQGAPVAKAATMAPNKK